MPSDSLIVFPILLFFHGIKMKPDGQLFHIYHLFRTRILVRRREVFSSNFNDVIKDLFLLFIFLDFPGPIVFLGVTIRMEYHIIISKPTLNSCFLTLFE